MYNAVFEADNGRKYVFGIDGKTAFDMGIGSGVPVDIGTSQGFLQVGETVENYTISGRTIEVKGAIYNDIPKRKKEMRGVFAPFVSGKLTIQGKYFIRVYVKETPTFSPKNDDGRFTMVLFAPYPYFYDVNEVVKTVGTIKPMFSFPINYATPHKFGERVGESYINLLNEGDVNAPIDDAGSERWWYLTQEEVDLIFSADKELRDQKLRSRYTAYANGEIYTPRWICLHTAEDYIAAGLTKEQMMETVSTWNHVGVPIVVEPNGDVWQDAERFKKVLEYVKIEIDKMP